jgi:hypothetical protein
MKRAFLGCFGLLVAGAALSQVFVQSPPSGLYGGSTLPAGPFVLPAGTSAVTQNPADQSTLIATDAFVSSAFALHTGTIPLNLGSAATGQVSSASLGSGGTLVPFATAGTISSILSVGAAGSGYAVGDFVHILAGNFDAIIELTAVTGGGGLQSGGFLIVYGGTGYPTGGSPVAASSEPLGRSIVEISGTLTGNLTALLPRGTFLTASRRITYFNNTTGAFTLTVKLSNGADAPQGTGVVLPQGTANSSGITVVTDGQNDVWRSN